MTADGAVRAVALDRPATGRARADADGLRLEVYLAPPTAIPSGSGGYGFDHHRVTVRLPWEALRRPSVAVAEHGRAVFDDGPEHLHRLDPDGPGRRIGDRTWRAGRVDTGPRHDREIVAAAHDGDGAEVLRVPLGRGHVVAGLPAHDRLWFVVSRRDPGGGRGAEVVAVDPRTGAVTTVLARDAVDVTGLGWARPSAPPPAAEPHARHWLERLADLDHTWHPQDGGPVTPLADGMSGAVAELVGDWPDRAVEVTFRHPWFPGGLLRRRIPLFDELGRVEQPEYCTIDLMEDLETGDLPPVSEAVDGVLRI